MIKKIAAILTVVAVMVAAGAALSSPAMAACTGTGCIGTAVNEVNPSPNGDKLPDIIKKIVNLLLYVIGAVAVIMIVVGGIKYVVSNGDSSAVTSAKNTIFYAVIGIVVAILAYAIVNFVITSFI